MSSRPSPLIFVSIPGLRARDLARMPHLSATTGGGSCTGIVPSFPCVTWPVQTNMLTGKLPAEHGIVANGLYDRSSQSVNMWTSPCDTITATLIWDRLREGNSGLRSAVWFPMLSKGSHADWVCMPAPVHNPDGSESLWCYTRPPELYGELKEALGHFPLQNFWGPLAGIASSRWIAQSAVMLAAQQRPDFFYIYLPHLDYAAQKSGPDSPAAIAALADLDGVIEEMVLGMRAAYAPACGEITWMVASEYAITDVSHVVYTNRVLRDEGLLRVKLVDGEEHLDLAGSLAWALVDHQLSHVFVRDGNDDICRRVTELFQGEAGIAQVLGRDEQAQWGIAHPRTGDIVLVSSRESWQAYYWWHDDALAPSFARTVDIHRKPGYDPVELYFDPVKRQIPLDATLVRGSHGAPANDPDQQGVFLCSSSLPNLGDSIRDVDLFQVVENCFARD